jgi:hypothetical protein
MLSTPRQKTKKYLALLAFALAMTSCSGSTDSAETAVADDPSASSDEAENSDSSDESSEDGGADSASDSADEPEIADEPVLPMANGVEIVQLTDKSGGGPRPILAWEPVTEADSYTVVVYDADGAPWWSWAGTNTEVVIGGVETDTEIGGPRAVEGARWSVMAFDTEGNLVGASPKRSIQP